LVVDDLVIDTMRFGRTGTEARAQDCSDEDVDGDGRLDVVCVFDMRATGLGAGTRAALIRFRTSDGEAHGGAQALYVTP
jgi:hypothetical protein